MRALVDPVAEFAIRRRAAEKQARWRERQRSRASRQADDNTAATPTTAAEPGDHFLECQPAASTDSPTAPRGLSKGLSAQVRFVRGIRIPDAWAGAASAVIAAELEARAAAQLQQLRVGRNVLLPGYGDARDVARTLDAKTRSAVECLASVMSKIAQRAGRRPRVAGYGVRPAAFFFRQYEGGRVSVADAERHVDTLDSLQDDGGLVEDARPMLSVVLVISGGVSNSGIDLEVVSRDRGYPLFLESGDAVVLGPQVKHGVFFAGDDHTPRKWTRRIAAVAFFADPG